MIRHAVAGAGLLGESALNWGAQTAIGTGIGAFSGAVMAGRDNRMRGAIGGGLAGLVGGAAISRYARTGSAASWRGAAALGRKGIGAATHPWAPDFLTNNINQYNQRMFGAVAGFHNPANRRAVFRSGALLGGGAFGLMFAGSGRSHKRGFNANRGNGFGR